MTDDAEKRTLNLTFQMPGGRQWTVEDAITWCLVEKLDPVQVGISGGHLIYQREETDEEYERRLEYTARADDRHREWIKQRYRDLFGGEAE